MSADQNGEFGGEYMVQDRDHMSEVKGSEKAQGRQTEQSEAGARQQGGSGKNAKRPQSDSQRQVH